MGNVSATWDISLNTECPECEHWFDLISLDDFWTGQFQAIEHGTKATTGYEVQCPKCEHEFLVDFDY